MSSKDQHPNGQEEEKQLHLRLSSELCQRIKAAAALVGLTQEEYAAEQLDKATKRLMPLQDELKKERDQKNESVIPSSHEGGKGKIRRSPRQTAESQTSTREKS
jgi:hypothetical protein